MTATASMASGVGAAGAGAPGVPDTAAVAMSGIVKTFGGVVALNNVDFSVRKGEIHALLGENGAGKSTILKILHGVLAPDAGTIAIDGIVVEAGSPAAAKEAGVAMIFQEMSLIPTLTVAQNVFLTREPLTSLGLLDDRLAHDQAKALFAELNVDVDPRSLVGDLGAEKRQLTEIVKAISQRPSVLILDEPTSALTATEVEQLFVLLRRLRDEGVAIVYVSHRMDEIFQIADRATILRDGEKVATGAIADFTLDSLIEKIVGRRSQGLLEVTPGTHDIGAPVLQLMAVCGGNKIEDVDLTLRRGEVVGVAGLLGSGRSTLARILFGIEQLTSGEIRVDGEAVAIARAQDAIDRRIALIPEDRLKQGVITQHSVRNNVTLAVLKKISNKGWMRDRATDAIADAQMQSLRIKAAGPEVAVSTLSGGNQQKVVLGKWLATEPEILILDEPTAGIDIGSKADIIVLVRRLAEQGKSILLISSELSELIAACDRIVLLGAGRVVGEIQREDLFDADLSAVENFRKAEHRLQVAVQRSIAHA